MFKFITTRPLWVNILAGIALMVIIFFLFVLSLKWITNHNDASTVPYVMGKSYDEAEKILSKAGFEVVIQDSVYTDTTKPLTVLKQVPEGDELVKNNRTVYLTINRAVAPPVEMPNIVGYSFRSAEMALKTAGLKVGDTIFKPDFARNSVLEQLFNGTAIKQGTKIPMGSRIDLVLGNGIGDREFIVPQLVGKTYCDALAELEANGLGLGVVIADGISDTCNAYIYWQSPERYDEDKKFRRIRSGQLMDIKLQTDKPAIDTAKAIMPPTPATED